MDLSFAAALQSIAPLLKSAAAGLLATSAGVGVGVLQFFVSIVVAGFVLANSSQCANISRKIAIQLFGDNGAQFEALAEATIRSVTTGILGVVVIQTLFAGLEFFGGTTPRSGPMDTVVPRCRRVAGWGPGAHPRRDLRLRSHGHGQSGCLLDLVYCLWTMC
jgi:hypothetical protein